MAYARLRATLGVALLLLSGTLVGCGVHHHRHHYRPITEATSGDERVIGVSIQNREAQFYQQMEAGMRHAAAHYNYRLEVVDASRDNAKQQSQVEDFLAQHVSALVITPYDSQAIGSAIVEANTAHVPVFTADIANTSKQGVVVTHIASNNVQGGTVAARLLCSAVHGHGDVAIIDEPEVTSVQDRVRGFRDGISTICPQVRIVADINGGGERARSSSATEDILQSHPHLAGIFGINDDAALGAAKAVEAAQRGGYIAIVGYDATPEARAAIARGLMVGDAVQHPEAIGFAAISAVHTLLMGEQPPKRINVPVGAYTHQQTRT